jgi:glycogen synthase
LEGLQLKIQGGISIVIYCSAFWPNIGGMETMLQTLARSFFEAGNKIVIVTDTSSSGPDKFPYRIVRRPTFLQFLRLCRDSDLILSAPLSLRRIGPQLLSGRPIVFHHPNPFVGLSGDVRWVDRLKRLVARRFVSIVAGQYMATQFPGAAVIPNPYDDRLFDYDGKPKSRALLFVGRLSSVKGCETLIRALQIAARYVKDASLTVVGEGPERLRLEAIAADLGLEENVSFIGAKSGKELAEIMRDHRIMVVPSHYNEPFGIVAIEGLASGCRLIVSRNGGLVDAVGPHALTFENGNVEELAACVLKALGEPLCCGKIPEPIVAHLSRHRSEVAAEQYLSVFYKLVEPGVRRARE